MGNEDSDSKRDASSAEKSEREIMAEDYFEKQHNLAGQRRWYSQNASKNKKYYQWLGLVIIVAGAGTGFIQLWTPGVQDVNALLGVHWTAVITALLGALVVISKGIERIWDFDGTWLGYRKASESMKRERRLFINGAAPYDNCADDRKAFLLFINRIEEIIAEEQNNYWSNQDSKTQEQTGGK